MHPTGSGCSIRGLAGPTGSRSAAPASSGVTTLAGSTSTPGSASNPTSACQPVGVAASGPVGTVAASPGSGPSAGLATGGRLTRSIRKTCPRRGPTVMLAVDPSQRRA
jgi:hypothetical protein